MAAYAPVWAKWYTEFSTRNVWKKDVVVEIMPAARRRLSLSFSSCCRFKDFPALFLTEPWMKEPPNERGNQPQRRLGQRANQDFQEFWVYSCTFLASQSSASREATIVATNQREGNFPANFLRCKSGKLGRHLNHVFLRTSPRSHDSPRVCVFALPGSWLPSGANKWTEER